MEAIRTYCIQERLPRAWGQMRATKPGDVVGLAGPCHPVGPRNIWDHHRVSQRSFSVAKNTTTQQNKGGTEAL
ncbi:hypothetical protein Pmani_017908 [Petrolisthes manimaculis]|uniref:Uncharacterized protein n=1 Tax=Petrolisthes manimaculis TaxID=1843537 RepID=A0AAE1U7A2_9EUCA|nr:hypothetical protein Pmani_017908 [Petrolisthes manimaculis]